MIAPAHKTYGITGASASEIASNIESVIRNGRLRAGAVLPAIRDLAHSLKVSPGTIAAAYRTLQSRGIVTADRRRGTRVTARPPLLIRGAEVAAPGLRNLAMGNPDPALLPNYRPYLGRLKVTRPRLYGEPHNRRGLLQIAARQFEADGVPGRSVAIMGGALDAIERTLQAHLNIGDRVAVEDPGYFEIFDLINALGLIIIPVRVDECGMQPDDLENAVKLGAAACIITPRAQNPTGGALDAARARALRRLLDANGKVLVIEDDHAGPIAGVPHYTVCHARKERWAVVRSVSKSLGPDLRIALVAGDEATISRVEGRQAVGAGWVSHILQELVELILNETATAPLLQRAADVYAQRRCAIIGGLAGKGIEAIGRTGLNVWVPVGDELGVVASLRSAGWVVRAGGRYRIKSEPAVRISVGALEESDSEALADAFAQSVRHSATTRSG